MSCSAAIHIVSPAEFDRVTAAQTPRSERRAAIAPALGIASTIWGGLFGVEPSSDWLLDKQLKELGVAGHWCRLTARPSLPALADNRTSPMFVGMSQTC
jgi:hypothetical protein